ncbi:MAG: 3-deoxy-D-manno-octulosonic acid transferase [Deltaproteobacteria bacterium]|nr:3-deoxy-D-manno-octulosonic acid transferase [Deltaproteobacteria bacterium]
MLLPSESLAVAKSTKPQSKSSINLASGETVDQGQWSILYNFAFLVIGILFLAVAVYKMVRWKKYKGEWRERFGNYSQVSIPSKTPVLWVHAVSVGEVQAVKPLLKLISAARPDLHILLSTTTATGQRVAKEQVASLLPNCTTIFSPLDFPWVVNRTFERFHPQAIILVETELWPNLLTAAHKRNLPVFIVNGRLSERSARRYRLIKPWFKRFLSYVTLCYAQSEPNARRFVEIGLPSERVTVSGNLKYDSLSKLAQTAAPKVLELQNLFELSENEFVLVGGSTHRGEENVLLSLYLEISRQFPQSTLILAPRHPERFSEVTNLVKQKRLNLKYRSSFGRRTEPHQIVLLDTMGELTAVYGLATLVFVGKSLFPPGGGHNLLEPAAFGKVMFYGPYMSNFTDIEEELRISEAAIRVTDPDDLRENVFSLLSNQERKTSIEKNALLLTESKGGTAKQCWREISAKLPF